VNDVKLFSLARVLCALVVVAVVGIPAESAGTTTPKRSSVTRNPTTQKLSLTKKIEVVAEQLSVPLGMPSP